jgi:uncharacterized OB-fold protein
VTYYKPLPLINEETRPYWDYCKQHELRMQKCLACGYIRFPLSPICPKCHSMQAEWTELSGRGTIYSFTVYRVAFHPAFKDDIPYVLAIVQLDEGPCMESNIIGCPVEEVSIGMKVEVSFDDVTINVTLPKFRPSNQGKRLHSEKETGI